MKLLQIKKTDMKRDIKKRIKRNQQGKCALSDSELSDNYSMIDTDRVVLKMNGGTYTDENTRIVDPVEHMKRHGNYRERQEELRELKIMVDGREQLLKTVNGISNRLLAMKRGVDEMDKVTFDMLNAQLDVAISHIGKADRRIDKYVKSMVNPMAQTAIKIKGLGAMTIAYMLVYVDVTKARYASSVWAYCGYDKASRERYKKGVEGGGSKKMRAALYRMADSMIKTRAVYRDVYDREKGKLEVSEKMVISRNTQGKEVEVMWKETKPCHRHGAAIRKMIKHFLADWWMVYRTIEGLTTEPLYVQDKMGHKGIIQPEQRGWDIKIKDI